MLEFELRDPPKDGVSSLNFSQFSNNLLLSTSWDKKSRVYDVTGNMIMSSFSHESPVLDGTFISENEVVSGGLDGSVVSWRIGGGDSSNPNGSRVLVKHSEPVKAIVYNRDHGVVISGGWDCRVNLCDPRVSSGSSSRCASLTDQQERVYSMDTCGNKLVVATAGRIIYQYDLRNFPKHLFQRESSLRHQTRCVRMIPNGEGYVTSSIEGRVSVDFWEREEESKKFAFKCHRVHQDENNSSGSIELVYPVNAIAFHPVHASAFATGGSDGTVCVWDRLLKKRLKQFPSYPTTISDLSFSMDGTMLAIASSYTYDQGPKDHAPDSIFVRQINDSDVTPKK